MLALPLAIPTYIVAYIYVDLLDAFGPVQSALRAVFGWQIRRRLLVPERALARRRDPADGPRALSLRLSRRARDVPDPGRAVRGSRARARRAAVPARAADFAAAGAAGDRGRRRARAARNAQRHRRQRISRRADADAVDLHHLAQPRQPRRRGADRLRDARVRRRPDRARTLRPARPRLHRDDPAGRAVLVAHRAEGPVRAGSRRCCASCRSCSASCCPPASCSTKSSLRGLLLGFDPDADPPCPHHRRARRRRDRAGAGDRVFGGRGDALSAPRVRRRLRQRRRHRLRDPRHRAGARPADAAGAGRRGPQRGRRGRSAAPASG